jgi:hypothetical protein
MEEGEMSLKTYLGNGVFVKIKEPHGPIILTAEVDGEIEDMIALDPPTAQNLLNFLERMK